MSEYLHCCWSPLKTTRNRFLNFLSSIYGAGSLGYRKIFHFNKQDTLRCSLFFHFFKIFHLEDNYSIVMASAIHQHELATGIHVSPQSWTHLPSPSPPLPPGCCRTLILGASCHTSNSHWLSVLHMVIYTFQCYSLKSSYPLLLPLSPEICSLCLLCCPACRNIYTR